MTIQEWLASATASLVSQGIKTARLDTLILISDALHKDKAWILAHPEYELDAPLLYQLDTNLKRRKQYEPIAYIRSIQEFFGHSFHVTRDTLIPRPETEALIELLLTLPHKSDDRLLDIGTGSGCIAITAKLVRPEMEVFANDISTTALAVARLNARLLDADVTFTKGNLLNKETNGPFQFIIANLPYVSIDWSRSPETAFEPHQAIFAQSGGYALINQLISTVTRHLRKEGYLLLEADPRQHTAIIAYAQSHGLQIHSQQDFALVFKQTA